ncbi:Fc.00g015360.m01.CDS01 [Cosmosporella sp. VM-42]
MPARTLPTFTRADVEKHNSETSCYVTIGAKVFDITDFVDDHPGGGSLVLEHAGRDVEDILKDSVSHAHSEAAYEVLDDSLIGFVVNEKAIHANGNGNGAAKLANGDPATEGQEPVVHPRTGMSCEEDLSKETDPTTDYKKHKFLDLSRPLFPQIWFGGFSKEFYLDQVHRPRHYKGGASAPLFGNFLEPLSKTPWWMIPMIWLPPVIYGIYLANQGYSSPLYTASYFVFGFLLWSLIEYILHRFLFHLDEYLPDNRVGITAHFLLHGIHHYLPMDKYRLVMPPTLFVALATPFWYFAQAVFYKSWYAGTATYCGGIFGYICYDLTHYFLHHQNLPLWYKSLKKYHLAHHFLDYELGFGVTSKFWDGVFGTELPPLVKAK